MDAPEALAPETLAALLRKRATTAPLWIDVSGASMAPAIPTGSRVRVVTDAGRRPRRGEVWAFCVGGGSVVVHRALRKREHTLWFQGDANPRPDPPIDASWLVGRVRELEIADTRRPVGVRDLVTARLRLDLRAARRRVCPNLDRGVVEDHRESD